MSEGKVRLGLIGIGNIGNLHLPNIHALSNKIELAAVCDIIPEGAKTASEKWGGPRILTRRRCWTIVYVTQC